MLALAFAGGDAFAATKKGTSSGKGRSGAGFDVQNLYAGFGLSNNSLSGFDDAMGWQIYGGYDLPWYLGVARTAVEVGYMESGEFEETVTINIPPFPPRSFTAKAEAKGLWTTGVIAYPLTPQVDLVGRLGLDFGDDDGLMVGIGAGYRFNKQISGRVEYVVREDINSLQANLAYHF
jgi:hypothetical protein